jgi:tartrate-resistant acid phosphatase type 5
VPDFYSEPYLCLAGLTHKSALISWGAFYFRQRKGSDDSFKLVDDDDLKHVHPPRRESIGARSEPYGDARVEVRRADDGRVIATASTTERNAVWVVGLEPDTEYTYSVTINGDEWARGDRRDWVVTNDGRKGLRLDGGQYVNRFRTHPDPTRPTPEPFTFAVIGDFGVGVKDPSKGDRKQREIAQALRAAVDRHDVRLILTTGDNIYAKNIFGAGSGEEDDDWFFTYYQPYRYILNRVPVYPSIGNHDASESEDRDDRSQMIDNFYLDERIAGEEAAGRASMDPGLFYRFRFGADVEFICLDTSKEPSFPTMRLFEHPRHRAFVDTALASTSGANARWRIPFCHHPPFSAGPRHKNTDRMEPLTRLFENAGVRAVFSGHEHNFQHSEVNGISYLVSGAAGKLRSDRPDSFADAKTVSWSATCHFLLVTVAGAQMSVRAIGPLGPLGTLEDIRRFAPIAGEHDVQMPIVITAGGAGAAAV